MRDETRTLHALCDATILTGEAAVEGHVLLIQNHTIIDIVPNRSVPPEAHKQSYAERILAPGLIDAQVNGGGGILWNESPTAEACLKIAKAHRAHGSTHILPTCMTDTPDITRQAINAMREARRQNNSILGIHLEGPHISHEAKGIHNDACIRELTDQDVELYKPKSNEIMLLTVAPESVSPQQIITLREQGCIISLGHTKAMPEQIHAALKAGATGFTHLYNGMGGLSARAPGVAGIALDDRDSWCGLIADGHHVSAEMIRLAHRAKPTGKVFLVSDAMPPAASEHPETFQLYGETIHLHNGVCMNAQNQLAGSAITLLDAARHCVKNVGVELDEALRMASTYPAAFLGCDKWLGKLLPGFAAEIIVVTYDLSFCGVVGV